MSLQRSFSPILITLMVLTLAGGAFTSLLFTEFGQLLNMPSRWLYAVYPLLGPASLVATAIALGILYCHLRYRIIGRRLVIGYLITLTLMVFVSRFLVPEVWLRGQHHSAQYIPAAEADRLLDEHDDVFVLEIGGDARAYPRDWMMIPHIAGDTVGGEDVVMTYCALSNLPLAFSSSIEGQPAHLKVVSQVHNNLVMADDNSGELFQQITATAADGAHSLQPKPVQRMSWKSFRTLYPHGKVFHTEESGLPGLLDKLTYGLFESGLVSHYEGPVPLFPTLRLDDPRLPAKQQTWGINLNGEQVAYTREFLQSSPVHNTTIGGEAVLVAWFENFQTLGVFSRIVGGRPIDITTVDIHGNSPAGRLNRLPQYPHVFWMIWSHWYPDTRINS